LKFIETRRQFGIVLSATLVSQLRGLPAASPTPQVLNLSKWRSISEFRPLEKAFLLLESRSLEAKAAGRHPIDGDRMYANIAQNKTRNPMTGQFESHRNYIDIHFLVKGKEMIGSADAARLKPIKPYSAADDATLYQIPGKYRRLHLLPGQFSVFFPGQAHLPGCSDPDPEDMHKIVVKVLVASIENPR